MSSLENFNIWRTSAQGILGRTKDHISNIHYCRPKFVNKFVCLFFCRDGQWLSNSQILIKMGRFKELVTISIVLLFWHPIVIFLTHLPPSQRKTKQNNRVPTSDDCFSLNKHLCFTAHPIYCSCFFFFFQ